MKLLKKRVKKKHQWQVNESLKNVENVKQKMLGYRRAIESFQGTSADKDYRYLDEMLTRCMLELDAIETHGNSEVRQRRKSMMREVQSCLDILDSVAKNPQEYSEIVDAKNVTGNQDVDMVQSEGKESAVPVAGTSKAEELKEQIKDEISSVPDENESDPLKDEYSDDDEMESEDQETLENDTVVLGKVSSKDIEPFMNESVAMHNSIIEEPSDDNCMIEACSTTCASEELSNEIVQNGIKNETTNFGEMTRKEQPEKSLAGVSKAESESMQSDLVNSQLTLQTEQPGDFLGLNVSELDCTV